MKKASQENIYIVGAGGLGREIAATLTNLGNELQTYFIDDNQPGGQDVNGLKVLGSLEYAKSLHSGQIIIGIGDPQVRFSIYHTLNMSKEFVFPTLVHPKSSVHSKEFVKIEHGCYISDGVILTSNISIGKFTFLLPGVSLSHDTTIGEFCTLMPGVRISSGATIGNFVTIGAGSIIAAPVKIKDGVKIEPGSIITSNNDRINQ